MTDPLASPEPAEVESLFQFTLPVRLDVFSAVLDGILRKFRTGVRVRHVGELMEVIQVRGHGHTESVHFSPELPRLEDLTDEIQRLRDHIKCIAGLLPEGEPGSLAREQCRRALFPEK